MVGFDFNIDNELNSIRKKPGTGASRPAEAKPQTEEKKQAPQAVATEAPVAPEPREIKEPEPEGFGINQSHQESNNGSSPKPRRVSKPIDWQAFKELKDVFVHVGGERPVVLQEPIRRSQTSGIPEPMMTAIQEKLKEKYKGASLEFPWGTYTIDDNSRVFTIKSSLMRYLLFEAFSDGTGLEVQYAKQWLVSHQPAAFDVNFKISSLKPASDELDIYVMLFVAYSSEGSQAKSNGSFESNFLAIDQLNLMNDNVSRLMDMVDNQSTTLETFADRNHTLQTVMLLDRMGLLKGGLPKDTTEFIRVLEQNRSAIETMSETVDDHISAEKDRKRVLLREEHLKAKYAARR